METNIPDSTKKSTEFHNHRIQEILKEIASRYEEITRHSDRINELNGFTELCPKCLGDGNIIEIHRFKPPHKYIQCNTCKGKGKLTPEQLKSLIQT